MTWPFFLFLLLPALSFSSISITGYLTRENEVVPDQFVEDTIVIHNSADEVATIRVTLSDYTFNHTGETSFLPRGTLDRSNASWITTNKTYFQIPANSSYSFPYSIRVPKEPLLSGSYWSIFLIEPIAEPSKTESSQENVGLHVVTRYGVQVATHLSKTGSYGLKIIDKRLSSDKQLTIAVENNGTLFQTPACFLELINEEGKKVARLEKTKQRIYPGCSVTYTMDLSPYMPGKYKAMLFLDHGEDALFGAQYEIEL